ncbi:hypothetical protein KR093_003604 [Drosophila rubida]|uniref:Uncharacterized protein n=1 Tax=Drosophila rubida TaxID=30044 RepID=A0AAD4PJY1_9MUSC|nr:hypothetical protein KR093_003604 [Drosophila rubida]
MQDRNYEYCIKIIMVCNLLWDTPQDYDERNEDLNEEQIFKNRDTNDVDGQIRESRCVPNTSKDKLELFWNDVRHWQHEVHKQFLSTNAFVVKQELSDRDAFKINLWNLLQLKMTVICNRTSDSENKAEDNISDATNCDETHEIGKWINEQIKCDTILDDLTIRVPNVLNALEKYFYKDCCPYAILRDRIEVINDNIDTIMQMKSCKPYERSKSTGYAWLDIQNLILRLDYLNKQNKSTNHCCKDFEEGIKSAEQKYQAANNSLVSALSRQTKNNQSSESRFLESFNKEFKQLKNRLLASENHQKLPPNSKNCCSFKHQIQDLEKLVNEYVKLPDLPKHSNDELNKSIVNTNEQIKNSEILLKNEEEQLNHLNKVCSEECAKKSKEKINFRSRLQHLEDQLQQMMSSSVNNLAKTKARLDTDIDKQKQVDSSKNHQNFKRTVNVTGDDLKNCLSSIERKKTEMRELTALYNANMKAHNEIKKDRERTIQELREDLSKVVEKMANDKNLQKLKQSNTEKNNIKTRLDKPIQHIMPILEEKAQALQRQLKLLNEIEGKLAEKYTNKMRMIEEAKSRDLAIKEKIEGRLNELERKMNLKNSQKLGSSMDDSHMANKLDYLEARLKSMKNQTKHSIQLLKATIDALENRLKSVNGQIKESKEKAKKCSQVCDLGELPSIDELQNRLTALHNTRK